METTLAVLLVLTLAVAVVGFTVLLRRVRRLEERLQEWAPLAGLPEELASRLAPLEHLDPAVLQEELRRISGGIERIEALVAVPAAGGGRPEPERPERVRAAVARHLRDEGYRSVIVLAADPELEADPLEVQVEAVRQGLQVKGKVCLAGDCVTETHLDPSYSMFP